MEDPAKSTSANVSRVEELRDDGRYIRRSSSPLCDAITLASAYNVSIIETFWRSISTQIGKDEADLKEIMTGQPQSSFLKGLHQALDHGEIIQNLHGTGTVGIRL